MDINTKERELLTGAIAAARAFGVHLEVAAWEPRVGDKRVDAVIDLRVDGQATQYLVEVKKGLRPATLGAALLQLQRLEQFGRPVMLVTDYVTPQLAQTLRERGVAFLDAAGNAYINHPPVLVWVKGQRPAEKPKAEVVEGRAFQKTGLRVVFALLCQPKLVQRPYRKIAPIAGVAHGTVGWVMADLVQGGFIIKLHGQQRRLRNRRRLLDIWLEAYARVLRPKLLLGRYRAPARDWWECVNVQDYGLQLGAEPAAAELDHYLRPGITTFYGEKIPGRFIADHQLRADPKGDVELRKRFWNFEYEWNWPALVPPVLIYADLLAIGDARCVEAATRVYEAHLARFFEQD
jgi:hypothetical protein